jgi:ubiquitin C-terminal hydrolase
VYDTATFSSKKDQTHIAFPLRGLDLAPFLPQQNPADGKDSSTTTMSHEGYLYDLYALVNHHGRGLNEGHFTCYGHHREKDCWLLFNDARVNVVSEEKVQEAQAYLLFYVRRNGPV